MTTYAGTIVFDRIGRTHDVRPLDVELPVEPEATFADRIAELVFDYARPHLRSSDVEVTVDVDRQTGEGRGFISCGFHSGGRFTIAPQEAPA